METRFGPRMKQGRYPREHGLTVPQTRHSLFFVPSVERARTNRKLAPALLVALVATGVVGGLAGFAISSAATHWKPPTIHSTVTVVRPTPDVVVSVRQLAQLETTSYHIERVVDLRDKQSRFFELIESEDAILLVAAANVTAGVDLKKLRDGNVEVDPEEKWARITLPNPEIFHAALDNKQTFVHSRRTDVLAERGRQLESKARREAERTIKNAALEAGILDRACANAEQTVESLVRSLGYDHVEVRCLK